MVSGMSVKAFHEQAVEMERLGRYLSASNSAAVQNVTNRD